MTTHASLRSFRSLGSLTAAVLGAILCVPAGCDPEAPPEDTLGHQDLVGQWRSMGCEAYPDGMGGESYLTRDFALEDGTWHLDLGLFGDPECSVPLFSVAIDGPYELLGPSSMVADATEANFSYDRIVWTAHLEDMATLFTDSGCGDGPWVVGEAQDVSETGCIGFAHPIADCPTDHDIVSLSDDSLFFGQRVTDMCEEEGRPTALNDFPVVRE